MSKTSDQDLSSQNSELLNPYAAPQAAVDRVVETPQSFWATKPQLLVWLAVCIVVGGTIGVISRIVRPMISGPVHYESLVGGMMMVLFSMFVAVRYAVAQQQTGRPVTVIGLVALTWLAYVTGWSIMNGQLWDDLLIAALAGACVSCAFAMFVLTASRLVSHSESANPP